MLENINNTIFESIKHVDEEGREYWLARELQMTLEYKRWDKFSIVINNAKIACKQSSKLIGDHFSQVGKMIELGKTAKRKILRYGEDILDNMGSEELVDNWFRIIHTESKIKRDRIIGDKEASKAHYKMGKDIRNFIKKKGGDMPENLPTPNKSLKELDKEKRV